MGITTNLLCMDCKGEKEKPLAYRCNACNKVHVKNRVTAYYKNNRERLIKVGLKYYAEHREHAKEMARKNRRKKAEMRRMGAGKIDVEQNCSGQQGII